MDLKRGGGSTPKTPPWLRHWPALINKSTASCFHHLQKPLPNFHTPQHEETYTDTRNMTATDIAIWDDKIFPPPWTQKNMRMYVQVNVYSSWSLLLVWLEHISQTTFAAILSVKVTSHEHTSTTFLHWAFPSQSGNFTIVIHLNDRRIGSEFNRAPSRTYWISPNSKVYFQMLKNFEYYRRFLSFNLSSYASCNLTYTSFLVLSDP